MLIGFYFLHKERKPRTPRTERDMSSEQIVIEAPLGKGDISQNRHQPTYWHCHQSRAGIGKGAIEECPGSLGTRGREIVVHHSATVHRGLVLNYVLESGLRRTRVVRVKGSQKLRSIFLNPATLHHGTELVWHVLFSYLQFETCKQNGHFNIYSHDGFLVPQRFR
ncbi:hypothetical protein EV578_102466 [Streptomyces sp. BK205]|nr:hypothetical protein EV578_102466 [Streptomyces sp. BK205]